MYHQRTVFESLAGKGDVRMQHYTWHDEGDGSTGKGTSRSLIDEALGHFTGIEQRGYVCVITHDALEVCGGRGEKPKEQWSNLEGSKFAFVDDFTANAQRPLDNALLRQISGGNALSASRKGKSERAFTFFGKLVLMVNGIWKGDQQPKGSDIRRYGGSTFSVRYMNDPSGPNEMQKDAEFKHRMAELLPEFFFVLRVCWLCHTPHAAADQILPEPPSTAALVQQLIGSVAERLDDAHTEAFIADKLVDYALGAEKPSSRDEICKAFDDWLRGKRITASNDEIKTALARKLRYKAAAPVAARGNRGRTTVNVYQLEKGGRFVTQTLRPQGAMALG